MPDPAKFLYRVNYYDDNGNVLHVNVLAGSVPEACAFLGVHQTLSVAEVASEVQVVGLHKPHAKLAAKPPNVLPPVEEVKPLTPEHLHGIREMLAERAKR